MNDPERDPYKVVVLSGLGILGLVVLSRFGRYSGVVLGSFPQPFGHIFLAGWVITAGISVYGVIRQHTVRGILYEQAGQIGFAILSLTYGTWAIGNLGTRALIFGGFLFCVGIAATWRVLQIWRRRRKAVRRGAS